MKLLKNVEKIEIQQKMNLSKKKKKMVSTAQNKLKKI